MKIFVVLDETEFPCHAATYAHACQEHINDAIEGGIEEAAKWVVREFIAAPPAQTALTDDARDAARYRWLRERAWYVDAATYALELRERWRSGDEPPTDSDDVEGALDAAMTAAQSAGGDTK